MDTVAQIREWEGAILKDIKNANNLLHIRKILSNEEEENKVKQAALHSMRRALLHLIDNGHFKLGKDNNDPATEKLKVFRKWLFQQFRSYRSELCNIALAEDAKLSVAAIRTLIEFVKREHIIEARAPSFGTETFTMMLTSLLTVQDMDVDVLLTLREEVLDKVDCRYHALVIIRGILQAAKKAADGSPTIIQNCLDMLRVISVADSASDGEKLCDGDIPSATQEDSDGSDSEGETEEVTQTKRKLQTHSDASRKKRKLPTSSRVVDSKSHIKVFSKAWLMLLSTALTTTQIKLVLKHLPEHVIPYFDQPLLLADFLSRLFDRGGVIGVLALESLFQIIVKHNLDYPKYFETLYKMCTVEIFSAKYRPNFARLLHASLSAVNIPANIVAAFIKQLAHISTLIPGPAALFCIAQATWLLRRHPICIQLLHRDHEGETGKSHLFDSGADVDKCDAISSSLYEIEALQQHYLHSVSTLATALKSPASTNNDASAPILDVSAFVNQSYTDLINAELKRSKKGAPLAHKVPETLFSSNSIVAACLSKE